MSQKSRMRRLTAAQTRRLQDAVEAARADLEGRRYTRAEAVNKFAAVLGIEPDDLSDKSIDSACEVMEVAVQFRPASGSRRIAAARDLRTLAEFVALLAERLGEEVPEGVLRLTGDGFPGAEDQRG